MNSTSEQKRPPELRLTHTHRCIAQSVSEISNRREDRHSEHDEEGVAVFSNQSAQRGEEKINWEVEDRSESEEAEMGEEGACSRVEEELPNSGEEELSQQNQQPTRCFDV